MGTDYAAVACHRRETGACSSARRCWQVCTAQRGARLLGVTVLLGMTSVCIRKGAVLSARVRCVLTVRLRADAVLKPQTPTRTGRRQRWARCSSGQGDHPPSLKAPTCAPPTRSSHQLLVSHRCMPQVLVFATKSASCTPPCTLRATLFPALQAAGRRAYRALLWRCRHCIASQLKP